MSRPRNLDSGAEDELARWYAEYSHLLSELQRIGTVKATALRYGISVRTLYDVVKRPQYELRRKCRAAGIDPQSQALATNFVHE